MKVPRWLKWTGLVIGVLMLVGAISLYWLWRQITALPDWYDPEQSAAFEAPEDPDAPPSEWIALDETDHELPPEAKVEFPEEAKAPAAEELDFGVLLPPIETKSSRRNTKARKHELRGFHRRSDPRPGVKAVRASRARYEENKLDAGVVLDLSKVPMEKLNAREQSRLARAIENFPALLERDVYVGVEDTPVIIGGFLQLGADPQVRIGNTRHSLSRVASALGMSEATLRRDIDRELRRAGFVDPSLESPPEPEPLPPVWPPVAPQAPSGEPQRGYVYPF